MISSENRDRCIIRMEQAERNSMAKSRSDTASMELSVGFRKAQQPGGAGTGPPDRWRWPGRRPPGGTRPCRSRQSSSRVTSRREHVGIGHHVVGEGGGLGPLEVGVAGHDGRPGWPRPCLTSTFSRSSTMPMMTGISFFDIEAEVHRHLVVPAAGGVQPLARVADALGRAATSMFMWMSSLSMENSTLPASMSARMAFRPSTIFSASCSSMMPCLPSMVAWAMEPGDVLPVQPGVKGDGGVEVVDQRVGLFLEPSCPKFHSQLLLMRIYRYQMRRAKMPALSRMCILFYFSLPCSRSAWTVSGRPHRLMKPVASFWL